MEKRCFYHGIRVTWEGKRWKERHSLHSGNILAHIFIQLRIWLISHKWAVKYACGLSIVYIKIWRVGARKYLPIIVLEKKKSFFSTHLMSSSWGLVNQAGERDWWEKRKLKFINMCIAHIHGSTQWWVTQRGA